MRKKEQDELAALEKIVIERDKVRPTLNEKSDDGLMQLKTAAHKFTDILIDYISSMRSANTTKMLIEDYEILNPTALGERLGISKNTLTTWRWNGRGPKFFKEGKSVFYHGSAVNEWLKNKPYFTRTIEAINGNRT